MNSWHTYPSIFNLGHRAIASLLSVPVNVEEKVDGSQFSFGVDESGEIHVRSKGAVMRVDAPEKMFAAAVNAVREMADRLHVGWTYRGEYFAKPKHNSLAYDRIPRHHILVFDINDGHESYLSFDAKQAECERIGVECIPLLFSGKLERIDDFRAFLDRESVLGGQRIEGVVIKPADYQLFGEDKKVLMGKFVSEAFREMHAHEWKKSNPSATDIVSGITDCFRTPARWQKAVIHMAERGEITDSPKDIGALIKEVQADVLRECEPEIRDRLFHYAWPHIQRGVIRGLAEWYKDELLKKQFEVLA